MTGLYNQGTDSSNKRLAYASSSLDENYHYILFVFDNGVERFYIDNVQVGTRNQPKYLNGTKIIFGRTQSAAARHFKGNINMVEVYKDKALNSTEILQNYNYYKQKGWVQ